MASYIKGLLQQLPKVYICKTWIITWNKSEENGRLNNNLLEPVFSYLDRRAQIDGFGQR